MTNLASKESFIKTHIVCGSGDPFLAVLNGGSTVNHILGSILRSAFTLLGLQHRKAPYLLTLSQSCVCALNIGMGLPLHPLRKKCQRTRNHVDN